MWTRICGNLVWDVAGGSVANFQKNGTTMRCQLCTYDYISTEIEELVQASYVQKQEESNTQVRGNKLKLKSKSDQVWIPTYVEITAGNKNNNKTWQQQQTLQQTTQLHHIISMAASIWIERIPLILVVEGNNSLACGLTSWDCLREGLVSTSWVHLVRSTLCANIQRHTTPSSYHISTTRSCW